MARQCLIPMIVRNWMTRKLSYTHDLENFEKHGIVRQMYYTDDFEPHRNLFDNCLILWTTSYLRKIYNPDSNEDQSSSPKENCSFCMHAFHKRYHLKGFSKFLDPRLLVHYPINEKTISFRIKKLRKVKLHL